MKKITSLMTCVFLFTMAFQSTAQERSIDKLIQSYEINKNSPNSFTQFFTIEEMRQLNAYLKDQTTPEVIKQNLRNGILAYGWESQANGYGSYDISSPNTYTTISVGAPIAEGGFEGAGAIDPFNNTTGYTADNAGNLYSLDVLTGTYTPVGNTGLVDGFTGLAYNPNDGVLYGVDSNNLYLVNPATPDATLLGSLGLPGDAEIPIGIAIAFAIDGSGMGYTYDIVLDIAYSIDLDTGATTSLGSIGFDASFGQGMFYDQASDEVYLAAFNVAGNLSELRILDTTTGGTTLVGEISPGVVTQIAWSSVQNEPPFEFPLPYCGPLVFSDAVEPLTNVEFAGIANRTDAAINGTPAHEDFTGLSADVLAGESYDIALEGNTGGVSVDNRFAVFIDWNQNDVLDDAGEVYEITATITGSTGEDGQQAIQSLEVPIDALEGQTRMRVKKIYGTDNYLDPCLGTFYGQVEDYTISVSIPLARVQVVHNSPDPGASVVDVYWGSTLLLDDFEFRTATPFVDVPANQEITLSVAPGTSTGVSEALYSVDVTLVADETYIVVANGVLDPSQFNDSVNTIDFALQVIAGAREAAVTAGNTDVLVHHGSPDAPTVDVVNQDGGGILVDDISYPEFQGYLELPTADYLIDITTADNSVKVAGYQAYLTELGLADAAITIFASGFSDPEANESGPAFGLWVSLASGGALVELNDDDFITFPAPYCGPLEYEAVEPITNVEFAGIANRSNAAINGTPAHEDFTSLSGDVLAGGAYDIILEGNTGGNYDNRFAVFIDWNQDGEFSGAEEVYEITQIINGSTGEDGQQATQTLVVPIDALEGQTRMRVKKIYGTDDYLDPCLGTAYGQVEDYTISVSIPLARVQVVHNSPDPGASVVDVYLGSTLLLDDFEFRTATPFVDVPANQEITLSVAPGTSTDVSEALYSVDVTLVADETYIVVADGVLDPSQFNDSVNTIDFALQVIAGAREAAVTAGNTDVLVHHGSPDAPTVDAVNQDGGGILVDDISYPQFQGYLELPTADYLIDITTADNSVKVAGYQAYLAELGLADAAVTIFASGFLNPAVNQDGPAFGLWVSLASGGALVELNDEDFIPFPAPYCGPLAHNVVEPITNVEFAGIANRSNAAQDGSPAHENFTSIVTDVSAGASYDIILEGNTAGPFANRFAVFIDWNQDGEFSGAEEVYEITQIISESTGEDGQQATQTLVVPIDALEGQTRMRVKKFFGPTTLDPCIGSFYGQTEEYSVNVAGTLSISTFDSADFTYYPNPVKGILSISIASAVDNLKVYNMLGQLVVETAPKVSNPQVDMKGLQPGLYLVTLEVQGSLQTFRVVKQ